MQKSCLLCSLAFGTILALAATPVPAGILDVVTGAHAAYSLRRLDDGYAGNAILVRRASDNATLGIGFDANGQLDTASLLSFVGAGDGYVTTWYDQTGELNVSSAAHANQPQIVRGGEVITAAANGLPAVEFGADRKRVLHASYLTPWLAENTVLTAGQFLSLPTNGNLTMRFWTLVGPSSATRLSTGGDVLSGSPRLAVGYGPPFTCMESSHVLDTAGVLVATTVVDAIQAAGSDTLELFANGDSMLQLSNLTIAQDDLFLAIGGYDAGGVHFGLHGYLQEIVFYGGLDPGQRGMVEGNMMGLYIPEPSTAILLLSGMLLALTHRRRRDP